MRRKLLPYLMILGISTPQTSHAQLVINEIMQSNIDCIIDDLNEFPDSWVEICNVGKSTVRLSDYKIGLTANADEAWKLPTRQIAPQQHLLIYCDKEGSGLHTSFKLESGKGGALYLFNNNQVCDQLTEIPKQPAPNVSFGRKTDGDPTWGYQAVPTPSASNCGRLCSEVLDAPVFSEKGKVMTGSQTIHLLLSLPAGSPKGTVIRYTTNGDEPTSTSTAYTSPITIRNTQHIRAKLFCDGYLSPRSTTHSYIFFPRKVTLPVISIVTNKKYFYDDKIGIYVKGTYKSSQSNYKYNWRRPINIEYFEGADRESEVNQLCETRVQGGASRDSQLKSLIVYANKRFGEKRLRYEFFPDQRPGQDDFKSIILRNAGNDFDYLYMRDAIIQRTMGQNADLDWQAWRPAIIYFNGTYMGMLNIRERSTADNIYTNYSGLEDIDMIENWHEVKEGDSKNWERFKSFYNEPGHTLEEYAQWIDWKEFINLMVMNLYYNNQDFPGNNIVMWRPRSSDGRWRFIAKDTDFGIGLYGSSSNYNSIEWLYDPNYDASRNWGNKSEYTKLFRSMMEDEDFKREFLDHATVYMGDFLNALGTREVWDPMYELIKTEYPSHRKLINQWWPNYTTELTNARNWLSSRTSNFHNHLSKFYNLGKAIPVEVNQQASETDLHSSTISINGIRLTKGTFNGSLYTGRSYTFSSTGGDSRQVTGWTVTQISSSGKMSRTVKGSSLTMTIPTTQKIFVEAIYDDADGIYTQPEHTWGWRLFEGVLVLHDIAKGTRVVVYDMNGLLLRSLISNGTDIEMPLPHHGVYVVKVGEEAIKLGM